MSRTPFSVLVQPTVYCEAPGSWESLVGRYQESISSPIIIDLYMALHYVEWVCLILLHSLLNWQGKLKNRWNELTVDWRESVRKRSGAIAMKWINQWKWLQARVWMMYHGATSIGVSNGPTAEQGEIQRQILWSSNRCAKVDEDYVDVPAAVRPRSSPSLSPV